MEILGFDWDKGNREKCLKHGFALEETEIFFREKKLFIHFDRKHSGHEQRYMP